MDFTEETFRKIVKYGFIMLAGMFLLGAVLSIFAKPHDTVTPPTASGRGASASYSDIGGAMDISAYSKTQDDTLHSNPNPPKGDNGPSGWAVLVGIVTTIAGVFVYIFRTRGQPWFVPTF